MVDGTYRSFHKVAVDDVSDGSRSDDELSIRDDTTIASMESKGDMSSIKSQASKTQSLSAKSLASKGNMKFGKDNTAEPMAADSHSLASSADHSDIDHNYSGDISRPKRRQKNVVAVCVWVNVRWLYLDTMTSISNTE